MYVVTLCSVKQTVHRRNDTITAFNMAVSAKCCERYFTSHCAAVKRRLHILRFREVLIILYLCRSVGEVSVNYGTKLRHEKNYSRLCYDLYSIVRFTVVQLINHSYRFVD
jgi:hypothetical protein